MMSHDSAPAVSVVICFLDEEAFLADAIESVLSQSFQDWELLLVDDGSSDRSTEIALQYVAQYPGKFIYLSHPDHANLGISASRNLGVSRSRGRYIAFLDGDDVYLPGRLARHVQVLDAVQTIDMVQSDLVHWHSWMPQEFRREDDYVRPAVAWCDRVLPAPMGLFSLMAVPELSPGVCSLTIRRSVVIELGGWEIQFRSLFEDQVFLTKVYSQKTVYVLEGYLALYRIHPESTVERAWRRGAAGRRGAVEAARAFDAWRLRYLQQEVDQSPGLAPIVAELESRSKAASAVFWPRVRAGLAGRLRLGLAIVLPSGLYRRVFRLRRRLSSAKTLGRYRRLCREVSRPALASSSELSRLATHDAAGR